MNHPTITQMNGQAQLDAMLQAAEAYRLQKRVQQGPSKSSWFLRLFSRRVSHRPTESRIRKAADVLRA